MSIFITFKNRSTDGDDRMDVAVYLHGFGYTPATVVKQGKRKSLLRFDSGEEKWVDNSKWIYIGDAKQQAEIVRILKRAGYRELM